jgi:hypothetical protein
MAENVLFCAACKTSYRTRQDVAEKEIRCPNCGQPLQPSSSTDETIVAPDATSRAAAKAAADAWIGKTLGGCKIEKRLGHGGMAAVYRARHVRLDIPVAVKIMDADRVGDDTSFIHRFVREARSAARLRHPNVVSVLDVGKQSGVYFIIMELVEGGSVRDLVTRHGRVHYARAMKIAMDVARALAAADSGKLIHRDVKPDNIMLDTDGTAKLADLGLAKQLDEKKDFTITSSGVVVGTPYYISPEQVDDPRRADIRSDIYSLGATLYHIVCGKVPFTGHSSVSIMLKHLEEPPVAPHIVQPDVPIPLSKLILRMMSKDPADRPQTPDQLMSELRAVGAQTGLTEHFGSLAGTPGAPTGGRRRITWQSAVWVGLGSVLLAATMAAALILVRGGLRGGPGGDGDQPTKPPVAGAPIRPCRIIVSPDLAGARTGGGRMIDLRGLVRDNWTLSSNVARLLGHVDGIEATALPFTMSGGSATLHPTMVTVIKELRAHAVVRVQLSSGQQGAGTVRFTWQEGNRTEMFYEGRVKEVTASNLYAVVERCAGIVAKQVAARAHWAKPPEVPRAKDALGPSPEVAMLESDARLYEEVAEWGTLVMRLANEASLVSGSPELGASRVLAAFSFGNEEKAKLFLAGIRGRDGADDETGRLVAVLKALVRGDGGAAQRAAERYIEGRPGAARGHYLLGLAREKGLKQPDEALAAYHRGLVLDPFYLPCLEGVVRTLVEADRKDEVRGFIEAYRKRLDTSWALAARVVERVVGRYLEVPDRPWWRRPGSGVRRPGDRNGPRPRRGREEPPE